MSIIYAAPGATFESTVDTDITGLVGTIGARIIDGQGATTVARSTTGIIESPTSSGVYVGTLSAPSVAGSYAVVWDSGGGTPSYGSDALVVTTDGLLAATTRSSEGIVVARGQAFESTLENAASGLVGTVGVRVVDGQGNTIRARVTTGIIETPLGSGVYAATLVAPTVAGQYAVVWDTGGPEALYAADPLVVTPGADLTTLEAVRGFMQTPDPDVEQDTLYSATIARASSAISRYIGVDYAPVSAQARPFVYRGNGIVDLAPSVARAVSSVTIGGEATGDALQTLTEGTDYFLRPTVGATGVYTYIVLVGQYARGQAGRLVTVTGDWGYATVPDHVEQAALITVKEWMRSVAAFGRTFPADVSEAPERPIALPYAATALLNTDRVPLVG